MASSTNHSHLEIRRESAAAPSSSSDGEREFFQQRIAVFGKVGCLLSVVFYLMVNVLSQLGRARPVLYWVTDLANASTLAVAAMLGLMWILGRGRPRSVATLRALDAGGTLAVCAGSAVHGWLGWEFEGFRFNALMAITNILIFRAILLPSPVRRTLIIGALAFLPTVIPAWWTWIQATTGGDAGRQQMQMALFSGWAVVAVAVSSVVSLVVFGLRRRAQQAMRLGQYRLVRKIGSGSAGDVYLARHAMLRRPTAIKLLRPDRAGEKYIEMFENEVQQTSRLTHPNTVSVYDYGRTPDGIFYYAMEYLPGQNLMDMVRQHGPLPPALVIHILRQACGSLAEAHAAGLVHRDVKPGNTILCQRGGLHDVVKLVDFGLVKTLTEQAVGQDGEGGTINGTAAYLAPESIKTPAMADHRADLYALGVTGYVLLTGRHPFGGVDMAELFMKHLHSTPDRPSERLGRPLPRDLEEVILTCLSKDPADRPRDAVALRRALDACADAGQWSQAQSERWWSERTEGEHGQQGSSTPDMQRDTVVDSGCSSITIDWQGRLEAADGEEQTLEQGSRRGDD